MKPCIIALFLCSLFVPSLYSMRILYVENPEVYQSDYENDTCSKCRQARPITRLKTKEAF